MALSEADTRAKLIDPDPHRKSEIDRRTPPELLNLVEAKGVEIADALKKLRALTS